MTVQNDTYNRAKALDAALKLTRLRLGEKPGIRQINELLKTEEILATAREFENFIRG